MKRKKCGHYFIKAAKCLFLVLRWKDLTLCLNYRSCDLEIIWYLVKACSYVQRYYPDNLKNLESSYLPWKSIVIFPTGAGFFLYVSFSPPIVCCKVVLQVIILGNKSSLYCIPLLICYELYSATSNSYTSASLRRCLQSTASRNVRMFSICSLGTQRSFMEHWWG